MVFDKGIELAAGLPEKNMFIFSLKLPAYMKTFYIWMMNTSKSHGRYIKYIAILLLNIC